MFMASKNVVSPNFLIKRTGRDGVFHFSYGVYLSNNCCYFMNVYMQCSVMNFILFI